MMKKILLTCKIFISITITQAQITVIDNLPAEQGRTFNEARFKLGSFGHWPLLLPGVTPSNANKASAFVFETGDGEYYTSAEPIHHYSGDSRDVTTVLTLSGRYDTIKFPPSFAKVFTTSQAQGFPSRQERLLDGQNILLTAIAPTLNADDEMLYILTYKVPQGANRAKIIFFYNHQRFDVLTPCNKDSKIDNANTSDNSLLQIPRLRHHFNESGPFADVSTVISQYNLGNFLKRSTYSNNLCWDWNGSDDQTLKYKEHNIFISIKTNKNLPAEASGYIEAALLYNIIDTGKNDNKIKEGYNSKAIASLYTSVSALPHDPNYILGFPKCIEVQKGVTEKLVEFHIRCQNEGDGDAHKLAFNITMDQRLKDQIARLNADSFHAVIGKRSVKIDSFRILNDRMFRLVVNDINKDKTGNDMSLRNNKVPDWFINPVTWADITFSLKLPVEQETFFVSYASIVFSSGGERPQDMAPVVTQKDTIFITNACNINGMLFPRPKIKTIPRTTCCCKKIGPLCWYWWLAIAAGLILLIWLAARKRKNEEQETSC
jgi:hypothetical protein